MLETMLSAKVGDEQHGLDPSVDGLCARTAELLGKEAALFLPSGTMCNEIAILVHCRPGDEIYAHESAHIIISEGGGPSALSGAGIYAMRGERGIYSAGALTPACASRAAIRPNCGWSSWNRPPMRRWFSLDAGRNRGGGRGCQGTQLAVAHGWGAPL